MTNVKISSSIKRLSTDGIISILKEYSHIKLFSDESRNELEQILQLNIDSDIIDEIEVIIALSGE